MGVRPFESCYVSILSPCAVCRICHAWQCRSYMTAKGLDAWITHARLMSISPLVNTDKIMLGSMTSQTMTTRTHLAAYPMTLCR